MKKLATLLLAGICLLYACKKEQKNMGGSVYNPQRGNMRTVNLQQFEPNTMSWANLVIGTDQEDVGYRKAQLFLSIGLAEVVKDSVIAHWLTTRTKSATDNVIFFDDLFAQFPSTKQIIEGVTDPLGEMDGWSFEQVEALMQYNGYTIKPSIYLANADTADATYKPICTPGYDLDLGENDTHPSDVVLGWHLGETNTISRINLWEEIAYKTVAPVLAIDGRATNLGSLMRTLEEDPIPGTIPPQTDYPNLRVSVVKYRIHYRYDVGNRSELYVAGACCWKEGGRLARTFLRHSCFDHRNKDFKELRQIHKNDIGNWWTNQDSYFCRHHSPNPANPGFGEFDYNYVGTTLNNRKLLAYNIYEHDGFASPKPLSPNTVTLTGSLPSVVIPIGLKGKMSKYNEWYLFDPGWGSFTTLAGSPFLVLPYPYVGWTHNASSGKGDLGLKTLRYCDY